MSWYGLQQRIFRWNTTQRLGGFNVAVFGHFHTNGWWPFNELQAFLTGTLVKGDDWALENFGWEAANRWMLFGMSEKYPVTWTYPVPLYE